MVFHIYYVITLIILFVLSNPNVCDSSNVVKSEQCFHGLFHSRIVICHVNASILFDFDVVRLNCIISFDNCYIIRLSKQ